MILVLTQPQSSFIKLTFFLAFSRGFFMQIDGGKWPLLLQCFLRVFGSGFSFHGSFLLCWFCDYESFLGIFLYGLARSYLGL